MGCSSFLSVKSGKAALSTSFDGSPCWLFKIYDKEVIEYMHGNYDSYGNVFNNEGGSFKWDNPYLPTAMLLEDEWKEGDPFPDKPSDMDPDQGWGKNGEYLDDTRDSIFQKVKNPKHVIFKDKALKAKIEILNDKLNYEIITLNSNKENVEKYTESKNDYLRDAFISCVNSTKERIEKIKLELSNLTDN